MVFARIAFFILLFAGLTVWITQFHSTFAASSPPVSASLASLQAGVLATKTTSLPTFDESGVLIYDTSTGNPGTPYLVYENSKNSIVTKQLIFNENRGCDTDAGSIPCTAYSDYGSSVPVPAGTALHIIGGLADQAVFVNSYQIVNVPSDMVLFTLSPAQTTTLSDGTSVSLEDVSDNASCTFGVGCFGNGVERVQMEFDAKDRSDDTYLVPGVIFEYSNAAFSVVSIEGSGAAASVRILAAVEE